jgi:lysophospholipase L1-like esterase
MTRALPRRRFIVFALLSVALSLVLLFATLLAADVYVHSKFDKTGVNVWGYRGRAVGRKAPGEIRVVVLGGSTVLGYGLAPDDAFPHQLEIALHSSGRPEASRFTVVNLGFNNEGAYAFRFTLDDYAYLNYDIVVLYEGYNDLGGPNTKMTRHDAPIFRWTGYFPMLPMVVGEKINVLRDGDVRAAYYGRKTTFRPTAVARTKAAALQASLDLYRSIEAQAAQWRPETAPAVPDDDGCSPFWKFYCHNVHLGVDRALERGSRVIVVTQPYLGDSHHVQQAELRAMLTRRYASDARVRYLNLGDALETRDPEMCWDGMHLTPRGTAVVGRALTPAVLEMAQAFPVR